MQRRTKELGFQSHYLNEGVLSLFSLMMGSPKKNAVSEVIMFLTVYKNEGLIGWLSSAACNRWLLCKR